MAVNKAGEHQAYVQAASTDGVMLAKSATHRRDAPQVSVCSFLMVSPRQMLPFPMANTFIQTTASADVFTDTARMPAPIWEEKEGGGGKNEVVRFNQGGYICPTHNYEPRTLEPQNSCSFSSEWLKGWILFLVWMDNNNHPGAFEAVRPGVGMGADGGRTGEAGRVHARRRALIIFTHGRC